MFDSYRKSGPYFITVFPKISKMVGKFEILSSNFYSGLGCLYRMAEKTGGSISNVSARGC